MNLACIGINHRTAPIDIREKVWFSDEETRKFLASFGEKHADECILVSTCNRTELYYVPKKNSANGIELWKMLSTFKGENPSAKKDNFYEIGSLHAAGHLFKVASAIDSMVVGDVQILNQIKQSYSIAVESKTTGSVLNRLFPAALHVGKRSRTETAIGEGAVSMSYAAAELASKIFNDLSRRSALLIGAGETGELAAKHLLSKNLKRLIVANRTFERAAALAKDLGTETVEFNQIIPTINSVDIVIGSVAADHHVLTAANFAECAKTRNGRPLCVIDLGVPRNFDPKANAIESIFLHDVDALSHIIDQNLAHREAEIPKVRNIVLTELEAFYHWHTSRDAAPTIEQLREHFETIRSEEFEKLRHKLDAKETEAVEMLTRRIVNKILHTPMVNLRGEANTEAEEDRQARISVVRSLFGLDKNHSK